jgi:hypothetical protein
VVAQELFIAAVAEAKAAATMPVPSADAVVRAIMGAEVPVDREQQAAVAAVCSDRGWINVEGYAGAGKTTMLQAAVAAYRDQTETGTPTADKILVVCVAGATAERTGTKLEADQWYSVEGFCKAVADGGLQPTDRTVIFVDEAPMVDTAREAALLEAAGPARVVNVGDPKQLVPIGAGGWYLDQASRLGKVELTQVHRHKDRADLEAFNAIREGRTFDGLASLAARGRIHTALDRSHRMGQMLEDYADLRDGGRAAEEIRVVIDATNRDIDTANRLIQYDRQGRFEVATVGFEVRATDENRTWVLHQGDQVIFLDNYWRPGHEKVRNGLSGTITDLDTETGAALITLSDGREVSVALEAELDIQPVGLAYAMHASKIQGGEVAVVLALPGGERITSLNAGYSQLTRSVEEAHVYLDFETHGADPLATLAASWKTPVEKRSATSLLEAETLGRSSADGKAAAAQAGQPGRAGVAGAAAPGRDGRADGASGEGSRRPPPPAGGSEDGAARPGRQAQQPGTEGVSDAVEPRRVWPETTAPPAAAAATAPAAGDGPRSRGAEPAEEQQAGRGVAPKKPGEPPRQLPDGKRLLAESTPTPDWLAAEQVMPVDPQLDPVEFAPVTLEPLPELEPIQLDDIDMAGSDDTSGVTHDVEGGVSSASTGAATSAVERTSPERETAVDDGRPPVWEPPPIEEVMDRDDLWQEAEEEGFGLE